MGFEANMPPAFTGGGSLWSSCKREAGLRVMEATPAHPLANDLGAAFNRRVWGVGALLKAIADSLEARFNPIVVSGEIIGFSRATSGHCYFSLKDEQGQLKCAMFRRASNLLDFAPADGQQVEVRGRLGVYDQRGELQMVAESMQRAGEGDLFRLFTALKLKLQTEGLFDASRKRPLPLFPKAIGVVTSLGAAALHDVVHALERRVPHIPVVVYPTSVQGASAAADLQLALTTAFQRREVDILLLVRGGGSIEDLWAFNDERLARLIAESPIVLATGIGHETDFTIADFCADLRAPTPTAAAELCAQPREVLSAATELMLSRLQTAAYRRLDQQAQQLDHAASQLARPSHWLTRHDVQLQSAARHLEQTVAAQFKTRASRLGVVGNEVPRQFMASLTGKKDRLERSRFRLGLLDPALVLQRGYAWLVDAGGRPVTSAKSLKTNQPLRATLADGEVDLRVAPPRLV